MWGSPTDHCPWKVLDSPPKAQPKGRALTFEMPPPAEVLPSGKAGFWPDAPTLSAHFPQSTEKSQSALQDSSDGGLLHQPEAHLVSCTHSTPSASCHPAPWLSSSCGST